MMAASPRYPVLIMQRWLTLWRTLVAQDLAVRYRGTLLGRLWPLLLPLLLLALYSFVFGAVFRARWPGLADDDQVGFVLNLFIGLLVHGVLAETIGQAPSLMQRNSNFVRKMVFPLPVLVGVPLGAALFHAAIGFALIYIGNGLFGGGWHVEVLWLPLVLLPYLALLAGVALALSALGVYIRDLGQITSMAVMALLFTGPVFYPRDMVPERLSGVIAYNPITWPTEAIRGCLIHGETPDWGGLVAYSGVAMLILGFGVWLFRVLRRGFADLL